MNEADRLEIVRRLHAEALPFVVVTSGGGASALGDLTAQAGASRSLLAGHVPYAGVAMDAFLKTTPEQYCSEPTARMLACKAWQEACRLSNANADERQAGAMAAAGAACTASLASDRRKRGEHRVHVASHTAERTVSWSLELTKGARQRSAEGRLAADLLLSCMAHAADLPFGYHGVSMLPGESILEQTTQADVAWTRVVTGETAAVLWDCGQRQAVREITPGSLSGSSADVGANGTSDPPLLFPGSFNPLHRGHVRMAEVAAELKGRAVTLEITLDNADKPPVDFIDLKTRLSGLGERPVWLTAAPTFVEKARLMPGCTFVVGADTITRIGDERFYEGSAARDAALAELATLRCRFLVFARVLGSGAENPEPATLQTLELPPQLHQLCDEVPPEKFLETVSSTELRRLK
jgi:hypothetical protein